MAMQAKMDLPKRMTADEFIAWAMEQPTGRYELSGGEVVVMAPERAGHVRTKYRVTRALEDALAGHAPDCEVLVEGLAVRIDDSTIYEPDVIVRCGPRLSDDDLEAPDPVMLVEVLSPTTRGVDSGEKLVDYMKLPSLRHYLIIDTKKRVVVHHHRDGEVISTSLLRQGPLRLDPPGIEVRVEDFFAALDR